MPAAISGRCSAQSMWGPKPTSGKEMSAMTQA